MAPSVTIITPPLFAGQDRRTGVTVNFHLTLSYQGKFTMGHPLCKGMNGPVDTVLLVY